MEFKTSKEKSLLDNKSPDKSKRICIKWDDFRIKNENEEGDGNYYCYFYTRKKYNKQDAWNLDENHDPQIKKNDYGALYINYDVPSLSRVRFCLTNKKMTNEEAKNATPKNTKAVDWYMIQKQNIFIYDEESDGWGEPGISYIVDNAEHLKHDNFLMHFNNCSKINITGDKFKRIISTDLGIDVDNIGEDEKNSLKVYVFARFQKPTTASNGCWYWLSEPCSLSEALKNNFETKNCCNGYMKDILSLRFCITRQNFDVRVGKYPFDESSTINGESVFELSKIKKNQDEANEMVLCHKNKRKSKQNDWESIDAKITLKEQINNSSEWQEYKYISKAKVGLVNNFFQNNIIKTMLFVLITVIIGLCFGWIYFLISIVLLLIGGMLGHKFKLLPSDKKILSWVAPCLGCVNETKKAKENEMKSPELNSYNKGKNEIN